MRWAITITVESDDEADVYDAAQDAAYDYLASGDMEVIDVDVRSA